MKYLLLFPMLSFASFIPQSDVGKSQFTIFNRKKVCEVKKREACYPLPASYKWQYFVFEDGEIKEDATRKAAYEAAQTARNQRKQRQESLELSDLTQEQRNKLLKFLFREYVKNKDVDPSDL